MKNGCKDHRGAIAAAAFRACIALRPGSAVCLYNRALVYDAMGRADEAYRDDTSALRLDPALAAASLNRGILAYHRGRHREAVADFERALLARPDRETRVRAVDNLSLARRALGQGR